MTVEEARKIIEDADWRSGDIRDRLYEGLTILKKVHSWPAFTI